MRLFAVISILVLNLMPLSSSQANFAAWDQTLEGKDATLWLVKESEHFTITYPLSNSAMADKALNIAERVYSELVPFFGQAPKAKTQMALVDDFDFSNGWATYFPFAQIRLFSSPPDSINGLEVNDDWLQTLIRHEYVHVLHLEMSRTAPEKLREIFGRLFILFPHAITPSFMLEGLATYLETNEDFGYGRLQGSYYAMQMRMEVAESRLKSLGDVAAPLREWPLGMQYLYGSYFYKFIAQTYGEESIQAYLNQYSGQVFPAIVQNNSMRKVLRKNFDQLWQEYHAWLNQQFELDIEEFEQSKSQGEVMAFQQGKAGLFKDASNSVGDDFYYIDNNGEDTPRLNKYSAEENQVTEIAETKNILAMDINDNGDIVASRMISWLDGRSWADVYILREGLFGNYWQALSEKSRLRNVRWLNNDLMIASRKVNGISELVILDKQGNQHSLWRGEDETTVIGDYDISASKDYLVVSIKRALQGWNLERINLKQGLKDQIKSWQVGSWKMLTDSKGIENSPQILTDGRILFSADYDGIYNLYLLNPNAGNEDEVLVQLTNMLGGAFEPKLVQKNKDNNSIVFQAYTADGFEFRKLELNTKIATVNKLSLADIQGRYNYPPPFTKDVGKTTAEPYSPWSDLLPRWWFPIVIATPDAILLNITTGGTDTLARHNYSLGLGLESSNKLANVDFIYSFDNRYQLSYQRSHEYVDVLEDSKPEYIIEQDRWILGRNNILTALEDQLSLNSAIVVEREGTISRENLFSIPCSDGIGISHKSCEKTLAGLGIRFDNREGYLNSPGFSSGRYLDLVYESNDVLTGVSDSDYQGGILQGQWQEIFDLPGRRSLSLQIIAGRTSKNNEAITIGGENRLTELSLFGRDDYALRGYTSSVQGGNNANVNRINFNQWLGRIDKGWGIWPVAIGDYSADLYVDYGSAWQSGNSPDYLTGVGVSFNIEVLAFYNLMMPIQISFAHGLDDELGKDRASFGISMPY
jgi:hypothetical protein